MFIFSCVIIAYILCIGKLYIPNYCRNIADNIKYGVLNNCKEKCENYVNRFELSKIGLKRIKEVLLKSTYDNLNWFPISESILTINIKDFNANMISDLLIEYKNVFEWRASDLGDVLFILNTTPLKSTRAYMRNIRCYHILLDEFIYNLYKNLNKDEIKNRFGDSHTYLKTVICYYGISEGEQVNIQNKGLDILDIDSSDEDK